MAMSDMGVLSEFITGRHDLCMESSELMCLHCVDPVQWPLTADALNAIFLRHAGRLSAAGLAVTGAETLHQVAEDLDGLGVAYDILPYREPLPMEGEGSWHPFLASRVTAGKTYAPILLQLANAQALGYQPGLHYHGIAVFTLEADASPWTHVCGDPASPVAAQGRFSPYALSQLAAAQPCGAIAVHLPVAAAPTPPPFDFAALLAQLQAAQAEMQKLVELVAAQVPPAKAA